MHGFSRTSLGFRLISAFITLIVIVVLSISALSIVRWRNNALAMLGSKGETMTRLLSISARIGIFSENRDQLKEAADSFTSVRDVLFVGIYTADRKPLYLSDHAFPGSSTFPESGGKTGPAAQTGNQTLEFSRPVTLTIVSNEATSLYFGNIGAGVKEQVIGYVTIVLGQESLRSETQRIVMQNTIIALIFICASIVIVSLWVKKITRPLETLTREVKALGKGSDVPHVPVQSMDEVGRLATEFNSMLDERKIAEQTRKNILRDLHDGVGGMMTNIVILSEINQTKPLPKEITKTFATISALSREGITEIRSLIYSLDRNDLNWRSFIAELRSQGNNMAEPHKITFEMTSEAEDGVGDPGSLLCSHLFKIYRESLTNVIKHSQAKKVIVSMSVRNERVLLTIRDDGRGCNADGRSCEGRGIANMKSRAAEIGGLVAITGDEGTCVSVKIPFPLTSGPH
jgi:signal transduction histidine kinase